MKRIQPQKAVLLHPRVNAFALSLALAAGAQAQTATNKPPAAVKLPEVVVTGKAAADAGSTLTVPSPAVAQEQIRQVPGGAALVTAEEFKTGRVSTMKDVLEYTPGVFVQPRFGSDEARISIRGSGLQRTFHGRGLKLLLDGVPLNLADGGFDMQAVEPLSVSYVEVLRGGNALRYGSTTLGGAINYVSPTGHTADAAQARAEFGSFDYVRGQVSSGQVLGAADYYVSLTHASQDGFRAHAQQSNQRVFSNLGWRLGDGIESRMYYTYVLSDSELPGSLTKAQLNANPTQANPANVTGDQHRDFELHRLANKTTFAAGTGRLELNSFWSHKDLYHPISTVVDQNSNDFGVDARWRCDADWLGRRNEFVLGLSPTWGWIEAANFTNVGGNRGAKTAQSLQRAQNADAYVENRHWLTDRFALVLGAQFSWANRDLDDQFGTTDFNEDYWSVNPKAGFVFDHTEQVQFYGNVSRSFEPPSFSELGAVSGVYTPRDAQSAWTVELGSRGAHGRVGWDVTAYHAWVDNELLSLTVPGTAVTSTLNASTTTRLGVEAGANARVLESLLHADKSGKNADAVVARAAYQWNRFRFQGDREFGNNVLAGVPEHLLRFELAYQHPCGLYAGPNVEWVATKSPVDHANTFFADAYTLVSLKAGYRSRKGLSGFFEVRNLTDKRYAATTGVAKNSAGLDTAQFLPGDGRAFYGGVEWKF